MSTQLFGPPWQQPSTPQTMGKLLNRVQSLESFPIPATYVVKLWSDLQVATVVDGRVKIPIGNRLAGSRLIYCQIFLSTPSTAGDTEVYLTENDDDGLIDPPLLIEEGDTCSAEGSVLTDYVFDACDHIWVNTITVGDGLGLTIELALAM